MTEWGGEALFAIGYASLQHGQKVLPHPCHWLWGYFSNKEKGSLLRGAQQ
jgi:hypothetical protein